MQNSILLKHAAKPQLLPVLSTAVPNTPLTANGKLIREHNRFMLKVANLQFEWINDFLNQVFTLSLRKRKVFKNTITTCMHSPYHSFFNVGFFYSSNQDTLDRFQVEWGPFYEYLLE